MYISLIAGIIVIGFLLMPSIPFYRLASYYGKSKIGYGLLGILVFFLSYIIVDLANILFISTFYDVGDELNYSINRREVEIIGFGLGLISCVFLYRHLNQKWKKEGPVKRDQEDILDL